MRIENSWCNPILDFFFPITDMKSFRQSLKRKGTGRIKSSQSFYCGTVHCAKQRLQSLVGYEDLKSLPIKTSLETLGFLHGQP